MDNTTWKAIVAKYQQPSTWRALWQIIDTLIPYAALCYLMYICRPISWWLIVPLAIIAGGLLVRAFIIFHDCGHSSYFKSRTANDFVGFIAGILTFTPYYHWRLEHAIHHSSAGHLDKRGTWNVWTMTVQEYLESSQWKKFSYRLSRNPFTLFIIAPIFLFLIQQRFPSPKASKREKHSVYMMNAAILGMAIGLSCMFGIWTYLLIQLIILMVAGGVPGYGYFMCSTNLKGFIGNAGKIGVL